MTEEVIDRAPAAAGSTTPGRARLTGAIGVLTVHARRDAAPYAVAGLTFAVYLVLSIRLSQGFSVPSYDLGIFDQAVRNMAAWQPPVVHLQGVGFNAFADHFFPIIAVLVPIYWLAPSAVSLLVAQDLLIAASVFVVTRAATRHVPGYAGLAIGLAYAFSWGLQMAVAVQFHEVAFALPLVAASLAALIERRWLTCALWAAPLVFVKEDQALTVIVIAFLIVLRSRGKQWVLAGALAVWAVVWFLVAYEVMSRVNGQGWFRATLVPWDIYADPLVVLQHLVQPAIKPWTVAYVLGVTGFLALRSPLTLAVIPTLVWRFLADHPLYWGPGWHYDAVLMTIVFLAMIDAIATLRPRLRPRSWRALTNVAAAVSASLAVVLTIVNLPVAQLFHPSFYRSAPIDAVKREVLQQIPSDVVVESNSLLEVYLTDRDDVYVAGRMGPVVPDYVLHVDNDRPVPLGRVVRDVEQLHPGATFVPVFQKDDYVVLRRVPS